MIEELQDVEVCELHAGDLNFSGRLYWDLLNKCIEHSDDMRIPLIVKSGTDEKTSHVYISRLAHHVVN
ncbi:MAG: hypothetical protein HQL10_09485 [Nitrospirae bacterium]|nr:hypothetical protein [Nitrospirota bacterium]